MLFVQVKLFHSWSFHQDHFFSQSFTLADLRENWFFCTCFYGPTHNRIKKDWKGKKSNTWRTNLEATTKKEHWTFLSIFLWPYWVFVPFLSLFFGSIAAATNFQIKEGDQQQMAWKSIQSL